MDLGNPEVWLSEVGLSPVPLLPHVRARTNAYVLLNGTRGNFCLEAVPPSGVDPRSEAWSANVGAFVVVGDDSLVEVHRWGTSRFEPDRMTKSDIVRDLAAFHERLERIAAPASTSVIAHSRRMFAKLWSTLGSKFSGHAALDAFLVMLAACVDDVDRFEINIDAWDIAQAAMDVASAIKQHQWHALTTEFRDGFQLHGLRTNVAIMLRHASGPLFQEAHYIANFGLVEPTFPEFGLLPSPVDSAPDPRKTGVHFTPAPLARTLVEEALAAYAIRQGDRVTIFDPACGSGEFLREASRQLTTSYPGTLVHAIGWDISPTACAMARFSLATETRGYDGVTYEIVNRDALDRPWPSPDILLMNPPFISVEGMSPRQKEQVSTVLGELARGRLDMSSAFVWKAANAIQQDGVLAAIMPASFLGGTSTHSLRDAIAEIVNPIVVARLGSHELFQQARVDAGFLVGKRGDVELPALSVWADYRPTSISAAMRELRKMRHLSARDQPAIGDGYSVYVDPTLVRPTSKWTPRPYHELALLRAREELPRVCEFFDVRQGALTGLNAAFLIDVAVWSSLPDGERHYFRPAVVNDSVIDGRLRSIKYVFYPYGKYILTTEKDLVEILPTYWRLYLKPHSETLKNRKLGKNTRWWELTRPRPEQAIPKPKLVTTYFGSRGSFTWDESGESIVVQGYFWKPKRSNRALSRSVGLAMVAILNSDVWEEFLAASSDNVGGGQWNLAKRFVDGLPLPRGGTTMAWDTSRVLEQYGKRIVDEGLSSLSADEDARLNHAVRAAYEILNA